MRTIITVVVLLMILTASWAAEDTENEDVLYGQPILLTPAGQSAEGFMIRTMCMRLGIDVSYQPQATPDSLGDTKTLLLVAGGSSKGLGAAAIDEEQEQNRIKSLIRAARRAKIRIVTFHIGGKNRRGPLSDEFNRLAADGAEMIVVKQDGDEDGFFRAIAEENESRYISIQQPMEAMNVLKDMFIEPEASEVPEVDDQTTE